MARTSKFLVWNTCTSRVLKVTPGTPDFLGSELGPVFNPIASSITPKALSNNLSIILSRLKSKLILGPNFFIMDFGRYILTRFISSVTYRVLRISIKRCFREVFCIFCIVWCN